MEGRDLVPLISNTEWYIVAVNDMCIGPDVYRVAVVSEHEVVEGKKAGRIVAIYTLLLQMDREGGPFSEATDSAYRIMHYVDEDGVERLHLVVWDCIVESIMYR